MVLVIVAFRKHNAVDLHDNLSRISQILQVQLDLGPDLRARAAMATGTRGDKTPTVS